MKRESGRQQKSIEKEEKFYEYLNDIS